ncbi:wall-associated receptor kinase-like 8 [Artemisia annua]|uniref:Wall-associated receptor kinase-like 8 n=1 Tax=Artemisia annua TaxID=35608 RepID=A0A2U1MA23_ARTAN|nr:wall-associated receptor kinase-like 8 [Artemisia annua]
MTIASKAKPGCQERCSNITIPYPYGIGPGCYMDKPFEVFCNASSQDLVPALRFVNNHEFSILEIFHEVTVGAMIAEKDYIPPFFPSIEHIYPVPVVLNWIIGQGTCRQVRRRGDYVDRTVNA